MMVVFWIILFAIGWFLIFKYYPEIIGMNTWRFIGLIALFTFISEVSEQVARALGFF